MTALEALKDISHEEEGEEVSTGTETPSESGGVSITPAASSNKQTPMLSNENTDEKQLTSTGTETTPESGGVSITINDPTPMLSNESTYEKQLHHIAASVPHTPARTDEHLSDGVGTAEATSQSVGKKADNNALDGAQSTVAEAGSRCETDAQAEKQIRHSAASRVPHPPAVTDEHTPVDTAEAASQSVDKEAHNKASDEAQSQKAEKGCETHGQADTGDKNELTFIQALAMTSTPGHDEGKSDPDADSTHEETCVEDGSAAPETTISHDAERKANIGHKKASESNANSNQDGDKVCYYNVSSACSIVKWK